MRVPPPALEPVTVVENGTPTVAVKLPPPVQTGGLPVTSSIMPSKVDEAPAPSVTRTE